MEIPTLTRLLEKKEMSRPGVSVCILFSIPSHLFNLGLPASLRSLQRNSDTDPTLGIERDSPRDQLVVTLFLLVVFGLLIGAAIKGRMSKVVDWNTGTRRWWEVSAY